MMDNNATNSSGAKVVIMCPNAGFSTKNETSYFGQYLDVVVAYDDNVVNGKGGGRQRSVEAQRKTSAIESRLGDCRLASRYTQYCCHFMRNKRLNRIRVVGCKRCGPVRTWHVDWHLAASMRTHSLLLLVVH